MTSIVTYNINGIRAALRKGIDKWIESSSFDIICFQEIKANKEQFDSEVFKNLGYGCYINSAKKPGYSGVAILSKIQPRNIEYGCGIPDIDFEGRIIRLDFDNFSIMSVYFPSGSSGEKRQSFKFKFLHDFKLYIDNLKIQIPNLIISGDYNICHKSIDIHNPVRNNNTSGFLIEERAWVTDFLNSGFIDSFRFLNKEPNHYSWWSYRANARSKNLGWRIDYNMVSGTLEDKIIEANILPDVHHSDHCPVLLVIDD